MNPEDQLAATMAAGMADAQRQKLHYVGTVIDYDPTTTPKTVTVTLAGSTVPLELPHELGYGGGVAPTPGDVVRIEAVSSRLVVLDRLA